MLQQSSLEITQAYHFITIIQMYDTHERRILVSMHGSRCYILMNPGTFNDKPLDNTLFLWLLPCTCSNQRCQYYFH
jgi:hypothetical protein